MFSFRVVGVLVLAAAPITVNRIRNELAKKN